MDVTRHVRGPDQDAVVPELPCQRPIETNATAASQRGEEQAESASIGEFELTPSLPAPRDVDQRRELQRRVEDEPSTRGHEEPRTELYDDPAVCVDRRGCAEIAPRTTRAGSKADATRRDRPNTLSDLRGPRPEETVMAKKKKTTRKATKRATKAKMSGRKAGKQVKGGVARMTDPCEGGE
jgi:hypothetical protein